MLVFLHLHKGNSTQFTAESSVVFKMHDLLKKNLFKIQQSFQEVHFSQVSVALSCTKCIDSLQVCYCFFNKAALLRQNIDDAWKRSRFNRS